MSPFEFLLLNKGRESLELCDQLFTDEALNPTWHDAFDANQEYRRHLKNCGIDPSLKVKSYVLSKEDITKLLSQSTQGLDGIRIYLGHQILPHGDKVIRLFGVGCKRNAAGGYDDFNIPHRGESNSIEGLVEGRPCPRECGNDNDLNTGDD